MRYLQTFTTADMNRLSHIAQCSFLFKRPGRLGTQDSMRSADERMKSSIANNWSRKNDVGIVVAIEKPRENRRWYVQYRVAQRILSNRRVAVRFAWPQA